MALAPKQSGPEILRRFVPLNTLRDDALQRLMECVVFEKLAAGEALFHEGDTDHFNIYLLSGRVTLQSGGQDVDTVDAGSDTARFPLAHQIPRKYRALARTRVEIAKVDNRQLGELLAQAGSSTYEVQELDQAAGDWMSQLLRSRVFQQIPAANIQSVMMRMQEHRVRKGECIIRQGEEGDYFYLINQGRCRVLQQAEGESEAREVAQLGPGDSFGEEALLSDRPRSSTVTMLSDGVLLRLSKDDFIQFVKRPLAKEVDLEAAEQEVARGALWLDVRSPEAYGAGHLPNSISLPFASLRYQAASLDPNRHYIVYCEDGQQSASAAYLLIDQGFNVSLLSGGLRGLPREKLEVEETEEAEAEVISLRQEDVVAAGDQQARELKQRLLDFERKTQEQLRGMKKLKLALDKAKVRLQAAEQSLEQERQVRNEIEAEREQLRSALEQLKQQQESREELESQLRQREETLEQLQQELEERRQQLEQERQGRSELEVELAQLKQQLSEARGALEALESRQPAAIAENGLEELRKELEEAVVGRIAAEKALQEMQRRSGEGDQEQIRILQAELESLTMALEESDQAHEAAQKELDILRRQLKSANPDAEAQLHEMSEKLRQRELELEQVRERSGQDLREMRQALDASSAGHAAADGEQTEELRRLHEELQQLRLSNSADAAENAALKQDLDRLQGMVTERDEALEALRREQMKMEERIEDSHSELDDLKRKLEQAQVDAEEAEFREQEAVEARKQLEQALYRLQEELERQRVEPGEGSSAPLSTGQPLDIDKLTSPRRGWLMALAAALIGFALADGLAIVGGEGEIISGLISSRATPIAQPSPTVRKPASAPPVPMTPAIEEGASPVMEEVPRSQGAPRQAAPAGSEPEADGLSREAVIPQPQAEAVKPAPGVAPEPLRTQVETGTLLRDRMKSGGQGPEMVRIAGGEFTMGSDRSQIDAEERPAHLVAVGAFAMGRTEVTFDEYRRFAEATGRPVPDDLGWGGGRRPVINVSWQDARAYAEWLSGETGKRYRLPTETEWEYAAAAGSDSLYWWGYELGEGRANCFNCGSRWDGISTAPVASFDANPFGLHDMLGNVMEWVEDCYHPNYQLAPSDGSAWVEEGCSERVVRGGAFNKPGKSLRTTRRGAQSEDARLLSLGFRVVRELP